MATEMLSQLGLGPVANNILTTGVMGITGSSLVAVDEKGHTFDPEVVADIFIAVDAIAPHLNQQTELTGILDELSGDKDTPGIYASQLPKLLEVLEEKLRGTPKDEYQNAAAAALQDISENGLANLRFGNVEDAMAALKSHWKKKCMRPADTSPRVIDLPSSSWSAAGNPFEAKFIYAPTVVTYLQVLGARNVHAPEDRNGDPFIATANLERVYDNLMMNRDFARQVAHTMVELGSERDFPVTVRASGSTYAKSQETPKPVLWRRLLGWIPGVSKPEPAPVLASPTAVKIFVGWDKSSYGQVGNVFEYTRVIHQFSFAEADDAGQIV